MYNLIMEIPRYEFNTNTEDDLLLFLKTAKQNKNEINCDLEEYEKLKAIFPLNEDIKKKLDECTTNIDAYIDITSDDEHQLLKIDDNEIKKEINQILEHSAINEKKLKQNDLIDDLKDTLLTKNEIPEALLSNLANLDQDDLEEVFESLKELNMEQIKQFWYFVQNNEALCEAILPSYIKALFLPKIKEEYKSDTLHIFQSFTLQHPTIFRKQFVHEFINGKCTQAILRYLKSTNNDFKTDLLRDFVISIEKLEQDHIPVIEILLNPQVDDNIHGKLLELMSSAAVEFMKDNLYGKLLFSIVNSVNHSMPQLEQMLKHILGIHQSIWKVKVQKVVFSHFDDTLTQSLK